MTETEDIADIDTRPFQRPTAGQHDLSSSDHNPKYSSLLSYDMCFNPGTILVNRSVTILSFS